METKEYLKDQEHGDDVVYVYMRFGVHPTSALCAIQNHGQYEEQLALRTNQLLQNVE